MIRNVIFDMGNVLLWYDPLLPCLRHAGDRATAALLRDVIFGAPEWPQLLDAGAIARDEYEALVLSRLPDDRLRRLASAILTDWPLDGLYPARGMEALVSELHEAGIKLYVLSNACDRFREFTYKIPGWELFEGAVVSAEEKLLKPDPAIYRLLCQRYGLAPGECLFVDDMARNVEGARVAGLDAYQLAEGGVAGLRAYIAARR